MSVCAWPHRNFQPALSVLKDRHPLHVAGNLGEGELETESPSVDSESLGGASGVSVRNCQHNALKAESRAPSAWG